MKEDRVKRCRHSSCFVEFSLVTHASVSLHMHVVLHTLLLLWVNPKHCSCLFVCPSIFSGPLDRILVVARNVHCPPQTTSWPPAKKEMVRRRMNACGGEGGNVTHAARGHSAFRHDTHAIHVAFPLSFVYIKTHVHIPFYNLRVK